MSHLKTKILLALIISLSLTLFASGCFGNQEKPASPAEKTTPKNVTPELTDLPSTPVDKSTLPEGAKLYVNGTNLYSLYYPGEKWLVKAFSPQEAFFYHLPSEKQFKAKIMVGKFSADSLADYIEANGYKLLEWVEINGQKFAKVGYVTPPESSVTQSPAYIGVHRDRVYILNLSRCEEAEQADCDLILNTFGFYR